MGNSQQEQSYGSLFEKHIESVICPYPPDVGYSKNIFFSGGFAFSPRRGHDNNQETFILCGFIHKIKKFTGHG